MTLVVIFACIFFIIRRLVRPEVRNVSYLSDFLLALLVMAPFVTGYVAHQQWLPYKTMIIIHGFSGALSGCWPFRGRGWSTCCGSFSPAPTWDQSSVRFDTRGIGNGSSRIGSCETGEERHG